MIIDEIKQNNEIVIHGDLAKVNLGTDYTMQDYYNFMSLREYLPRYEFEYDENSVPWLVTDKINLNIDDHEYDFIKMSDHLFDYQKHFTQLALEKSKFAVFLDTGLGKTSIEIEFAVQLANNGIKSLIICPLLVLSQFKREILKFYPWFHVSSDSTEEILKELIEHDSKVGVHLLRKSSLDAFKESTDMIGLVNFEFFRQEKDLDGINGLILDESSILKSEHGVYGKNIINSCNKYNVHYRLAASATPAPNDYAELANHALFLGKIKTYSQFFGDWFQKDFKDQSKWLLRPHAKDKFYRYLSSWSILMRHPDKFGFNDNINPPPPYKIHIDELELTKDQIKKANDYFLGYDDDITIDIDSIKKGITNRNKMAQISRGFFYETIDKKKTVTRHDSLKPDYTYNKCINEFPDDQFIIMVELDEEEEILKEKLGESETIKTISGKTKEDDREKIVNDFIDGKVRILITKPKIIGFGLNLQNCFRMIYYGISDSYERFYQSVRRCYRMGQLKNVQVYIPITLLETPIMNNINLKSDNWELMIEEQENYYNQSLKGEHENK